MNQDLLDQVFYYVDALWRRRWLALGVAFLCAMVGWSVVASLPDRYQSSAKIYVDTASVLGHLLSGVTVQSDVGRQVEVMRRTLLSRPNLEEVARQTDLDLKATSAGEMSRLLAELASRTSVTSDRANIFTIAHTSTDPRVARDVVDALTTIFVERNIGRGRGDFQQATAFIDRQLAEYQSKIEAAERRITDFKKANSEYLPSQAGYQGQLAEARARAEEARSALADAVTRKRVIEEELAATPETIPAGGSSYGPPSNIDVRILEIESNLEKLRARYTDKHPDVVTLERRLESLRAQKQAQMNAAVDSGPGSDESEGPQTPNPLYDNLKMALVEQKSNIQVLRQAVARAEAHVEQLKAKADKVREVGLELSKLQRDYGILKDRYASLRGRKETAAISADRQEQGDEVAFRMIESPIVPSYPSGPNRALFATGVLFAAVGAGGAAAFGVALLKASYGSVRHLRRDFDIPIYGVISDVRSSGQRLLRKIDYVAFGAGAGVLAVTYAGLLLIERQRGLYAHFQGIFAPLEVRGLIDTSLSAVQSLL